jgi:hypothetical protein
VRSVSCLLAAVAAVLLFAPASHAFPAAGPGVPDSATIASVSDRLEGAAGGRLDTPGCRVYLKAPRANAEGITWKSYEAPVPENALRLPGVVPWSDVQRLEAHGPARIPLAVGLGVMGAVVGHLLWTGSARGLVDGGRVYKVPDRQAYYLVGGTGVGLFAGLVVNLWATRGRVVYPVGGK